MLCGAMHSGSLRLPATQPSAYTAGRQPQTQGSLRQAVPSPLLPAPSLHQPPPLPLDVLLQLSRAAP